MGDASFDLIPGYAVGENGQGVARIDHGVEPTAEEISMNHGASEGVKILRFEWLRER